MICDCLFKIKKNILPGMIYKGQLINHKCLKCNKLIYKGDNENG